MPEVLRIKDEVLLIVFGEDLEIIVFRHANGAVHGSVNQLADAFGVGGVLMLFDVDANQWHGRSPEGMQVCLKYMMVTFIKWRSLFGDLRQAQQIPNQ